MKKLIQIFQPKTKKVSLFGFKLKLYESCTRDFIDLTQFVIEKNQNKEASFLLYQDVCIVYDALKFNLDKASWFNPFKKLLIKRFITKKYIIKKLSPIKLKYLSVEASKLQGFNKKKEGKSDKKVDIGNEFLGSEEGYSLLMYFFDWTIEQIDNLPISKYFMFTTQALNLAALMSGGKYKFASDEDRLMFKQFQAFCEIQELKRKGRWH